ncbi:MAG TPA: hypothetical protein VHZ97_27380 [Pseudonocardiaceae bacterium]|nr:hypothetical protein [Pseudonocardiaceae bacterium]
MTPETAVRPDSELAELNINAVIAAGLSDDESARRTLFTEGAIAAALCLEPHGTGPYPVRFLARYVRAAGRAAALELPEPLVGAEPGALARQWLTAASTVDTGLTADRAFAQWLDMVAALIAIRGRTR